MAVLMALIVRSSDGLPLTASTDMSHDSALLESVRCMKAACRNMTRYPDRGIVNMSSHVLHFIQSIGVAFHCLTTKDYPTVLAFAFLDELQKEFLLEFDNRRIAKVTRPYTFIQFDSHVQKTKIRFNNMRSLSARVNLTQMESELSLRPPVELMIEDLGIPGYSRRQAGCAGNGFLKLPSHSPSTDVLARLEELKVVDYVSLCVSFVSVVITVVRCVAVMSEADFIDEESNSLGNLVMLLCAALCSSAQVYYLLCNHMYREVTSVVLCLLCVVCYLYLLHITSTLQSIFHILASLLTLTATLYRKQVEKSWKRVI